MIRRPPRSPLDRSSAASDVYKSQGLGLSVPRILEAEPARGLLLLEDLGDALYTQVLKADPLMERPLYDAAVDVLLALQSAPPPLSLIHISEPTGPD